MKKIYTLITFFATAILFAQDLVITVAVPTGTTSVRMGGPWWNGWDPTAGPVGVDNGNDTFTFTFNPAPTDNMEYLFTLDDTNYENLIDNASGGNCSARVDNGNLNTDYANYANRIWKTTDNLTWNEIYDSCSEATFSAKKVDQLKFTIYPNPTQDWVKINAIEPISEVKVYDLIGKLVIQLKPKLNSFEINTRDFSKGVYLVKLNSDGKEATKKLIIQ